MFASNGHARPIAEKIAALFDADTIFFRMDGRYDETSVFVRSILLDFLSIVKRAVRGDLAGTKATIIELAAAIGRAEPT